MKTGSRILLALILLLITAAVAADEAARAQHELETLRERISEVRQGLDSDRRDRDRLTRQLEDIEAGIRRTAGRLRELENEISATGEQLGELQRQRDARRAELAQDREAIATHLREAYITGRRGRLRMLLNQEDPGAVGRVMAYYDYINRARGQRIEALTQRLAVLAELEARILERREALDDLRRQQRRTLDGLRDNREARGELLAALEQEIAAGDRELSRLQDDEERLQQLVQSLQQRLADVPDELQRHTDFAALRGRLPQPVSGRITERFGAPRHGGRLRSRGVVFEAGEGTEIIAVSRGRVAFAEWLPGYGLVVILEHGEGFLSLYGHTREVYREVGDWVDGGDIIASVGDSGGRRNPALYFEIRQGREPVNPADWFGGQTAAQ